MLLFSTEKEERPLISSPLLFLPFKTGILIQCFQGESLCATLLLWRSKPTHRELDAQVTTIHLDTPGDKEGTSTSLSTTTTKTVATTSTTKKSTLLNGSFTLSETDGNGFPS